MKLSGIFSAVVIAGLVSAAPAESDTKEIHPSLSTGTPKDLPTPPAFHTGRPKHTHNGHGPPPHHLKPTGELSKHPDGPEPTASHKHGDLPPFPTEGFKNATSHHTGDHPKPTGKYGPHGF